MYKKCFKCNTTKPLADFYVHRQMPDGHINKCKLCAKNDVRKNYSDKVDKYHEYDKSRQRYNKNRIFGHRYTQICQRVQGRATRKYTVEGTDMLPKEDFLNWCKENMTTFNKIYERWVLSGFDRSLAPSIDRINNGLGYTPSNMQWLTVSENSKKYHNKKCNIH